MEIEEKRKQSQYLIFYQQQAWIQYKAPHRPPQGSTSVLSLPWKPAEGRARSSDLEEALLLKEL